MKKVYEPAPKDPGFIPGGIRDRAFRGLKQRGLRNSETIKELKAIRNFQAEWNENRKKNKSEKSEEKK